MLVCISAGVTIITKAESNSNKTNRSYNRIFQWIKLVLWNVSNAEYSAAYKISQKHTVFIQVVTVLAHSTKTNK